VEVKRRYVALIIVVAVLSLILGGVQMVDSRPFTWFDSEPKKDTLDDQRKFLKAHEDELVAGVKKINPDITSVQFDWNSVNEGEIGNGLPQGGGTVIEITGKFNNIKKSKVILQFTVDSKTGMRKLSSMAAPNRFRIKRGDWWRDYAKP
jgi:hypothetical protein